VLFLITFITSIPALYLSLSRASEQPFEFAIRTTVGPTPGYRFDAVVAW
jgi:hypothetical protein